MQQPAILMLAPDQFLSLLAVQLIAQDPSLKVEAAVDKAIDVYVEAGIQQAEGVINQKINARDPEFIANETAKQAAAQRGILVPDGVMQTRPQGRGSRLQ